MNEDTQRVSADQGLSTLGLIMQLFGTLFGVLALMVLVLVLVLGEDTNKALLIIGFGLSAVRSRFHAQAGATLASGFAGIRRYIQVALVHTVVMFAIDVFGFGAPLRMAIATTVGLLVWPAALTVMIGMPRFSRFATAVPFAEDKGFEGASILMTIMGALGAIQWGAMLIVVLLSLGDIIDWGHIYGYLFVASIAALFVRSYVHVTAGLAGVRETNFARSVKLGNRYAIVGFAVSLIVTGITLIVAIFEKADFLFLALIVGVGAMLLAWPLIVRQFVGDRQLASLADDDVHHRTPDAGLNGLGWLLIANALLTLSALLPDLIAGPGSSEIVHVLQKITLVSPTDTAWNFGIVAVELWAGMELVSMGSRYRLAATAYALVAGAWAAYHSWPEMTSFATLRHLAPEEILAYVPVATNLVMPVATLLLVRRPTGPTAQAVRLGAT